MCGVTVQLMKDPTGVLSVQLLLDNGGSTVGLNTITQHGIEPLLLGAEVTCICSCYGLVVHVQEFLESLGMKSGGGVFVPRIKLGCFAQFLKGSAVHLNRPWLSGMRSGVGGGSRGSWRSTATTTMATEIAGKGDSIGRSESTVGVTLSISTVVAIGPVGP